MVWHLKEKCRADIISKVLIMYYLKITMHFKSDGFNLNKIIANGKRFKAYVIINRLKNKGNLKMLNKLSGLVAIKEKKKRQLHKVFKDSFEANPIINNPFLLACGWCLSIHKPAWYCRNRIHPSPHWHNNPTANPYLAQGFCGWIIVPVENKINFTIEKLL